MYDLIGEDRKMLDDHSFISDISNHHEIIEAPVKKSKKPGNLFL